MPLSGFNVLLTGATRGFGAALTSSFWDAGANLLLVARTEEALSQAAAALPSRPGQRVLHCRADLADRSAPAAIVARAREAFDELHVLINNAGVQGPVGPTTDVDWGTWTGALEVNLLAPVALCRLCVPWMARHRFGKIINLSGGGSTAPRANFSSYATAKAGLVRFSETLASEVQPLGIDVNCVAPGAMKTTMTEAVLAAGPEAAGAREYASAERTAHEGGAFPTRAAQLCVFLASRESNGISGRLISAVWDPWATLPDRLAALRGSDVYTLRRIVPKDWGLDWDDESK